MPKIKLTKEELALARERAKKRLPPRISRSLRKTPFDNLERLQYPQLFHEEVENLKREKKRKEENNRLE